MKKKKIAFILTLVAMCLISSITYAADISSVVNSTSWISKPDNGKVNSIGGQIVAIMQAVGVTIAIIMLISIAIKYMTSSPNDKAEVKKHLVPYAVGALFIFAAVAIIGLLKNFFMNSIT